MDNGKLIVSDRPPKTSCDALFDSLGEYLRHIGFELVYLSNRGHREEAYRRGDNTIVLIYDICLIKTNLSRTEVESLAKAVLQNLNALAI